MDSCLNSARELLEQCGWKPEQSHSRAEQTDEFFQSTYPTGKEKDMKIVKTSAGGEKSGEAADGVESEARK